MGAAKPLVQLDWINTDDPTKITAVSAPDQLLGHVSGTAADPKIFNWTWNRISKWITFIDATFDATGNEVNAPKSTTITETVSPVASTVALDAGGIKSWDGSSNAIFSVTEPGVVTIGYNGNDIISLTAGVLSVATATAADLVKLHTLTPSAADLNIMLGADGNGLVVADITKLADIDSSASEINQLDDVSVGGNTSGDILTTDDTQTVTNKTIDADNSTISNLKHGEEVDDPSTGIHGVGASAVVGTSNIQDIYDKTFKLTCHYEINEAVQLTSTSTELNLLHNVSGLVQADFTKLAAINSSAAAIDAAAGNTDTILGDGTPGRVLRIIRIRIYDGSSSGLRCQAYDIWNGDAIALGDDIDKSGSDGYWSLNSTGSVVTIDSDGLSGNCVAVVSTAMGYCIDVGDTDILFRGEANSNDIELTFSEVGNTGTLDLTSLTFGLTGLTLVVSYLTDA